MFGMLENEVLTRGHVPVVLGVCPGNKGYIETILGVFRQLDGNGIMQTMPVFSSCVVNIKWVDV